MAFRFKLCRPLVLRRPSGYTQSMSRIPAAVLIGLIGLALYIAAAIVVADHVLQAHWALRALYFVVAGSLWVMPMRWLMYWSVRMR